jgi:menaquinone-specific isochorismate synthase
MKNPNLSPHFSVLATEIPCPHPWSLLYTKEPCFLWRKRDDEELWIGLGIAQTFTSLEGCREFLDSLEIVGENTVIQPRCFGAVAFDPETALSGAWDGFQARSFILPSCLLHCRNDKAMLFQIRALTDENTGDSFAEALEKERATIISHSTWGHVYGLPAQVSDETESLSRAEWSEIFSRSHAAITSGQIQKIVLSRNLRITADRFFNGPEIMRRLAQNSQESYLFYLALAPDHIFLGASPERLFRLQKSILKVDSLAGTKPRGKTPEEDFEFARQLLADPKELHEQQIVTNHLSECMQSLCESVDKPSAPTIRRLNTVQHLFTAVQGRVHPQMTMDKILRTLHPTPATCGSPVDKARELIRKVEPEPRGLYTGTLGWVDTQDAEFCVAIRSALLRGERAFLYAGAGIVADSIAEKEYDECTLKMSVMRRGVEEPLH